MKITAARLILPLPRPQYIRVPEGFITALAWREYYLANDPLTPAHPDLTLNRSGEMQGQVIFRPTSNTSKAKSPLRTTVPGDESALAAFGAALKARGLQSSEDDLIIGESFVRAISGVSATKGMGQAASPMTPALAMLQNVAGVHAALRPPNLGKTIELIRSMGGNMTGASSVSGSWARAVETRASTDTLLRIIDEAVSDVILPGTKVRRGSSSDSSEFDDWAGLFPSSPFSWFDSMWESLTSPVWVAALPARVWTDWATTLLRLAFGATYLWEASWYESIARTIIGHQEPSWAKVREAMPVPLPWHAASETTSVRDLAPVLMWRVHRATQIMRELESWLGQQDRTDLPVEDALLQMRADDELRNLLVKALGSKRKNSSGNNTWEAIKYALKVRESFGEFADHYGLLAQRHRFLTVEPKTEWVAVIASLSCLKPGGETDVGRVLAGLEDLGIRPGLSDFVNLLEKAGLARGSADADQGVVVHSAF